jgi:hypothetical protein
MEKKAKEFNSAKLITLSRNKGKAAATSHIRQFRRDQGRASFIILIPVFNDWQALELFTDSL